MAVYANLKDYFQGEHLDLIKASISEYCSKHQYVGEADSVQVQKLRCLYKKKIPDISSDIEIEAGVSVQFVDRDDNSNSAERFFILHISGDLKLKLSDIKVSVIKEIDRSEMPEESIYDQFLIPKAGPDDMERIYKEFCKLSSGKPPSFDIILKNLSIKIYYADFDDTCLGRLNLSESDIDIYTLDKTGNKLVLAGNKARYGTIILNKRKYYDEKDREYLITVCHELIHWNFHQKFFKILMLLGNTEDALNYNTLPPIYNDNMTDSQKALYIAEWQAYELSWRIVMPEDDVKIKLEQIRNADSIKEYAEWLRPELIVDDIALMYKVSSPVVKIRLRQLGYDFADGTCLEFDGKLYLPFAFAPGSLKQNETFVIDRANYERLLREDKDFADLINTSRYIYLGYVVCLLDPKYLDVEFTEDGVQLALSDYARNHANECCLKFLHNRIVYDDFSYQGQNYLSNKEKTLSDYIPLIPEELKAIVESFDKKEETLVKPSFGETLQYYLFGSKIKIKKENGNYTREANKIIDDFVANIDLSNTIIKGYLDKKSYPKLKTLMMICIELGLDSEKSRELINMAGINIDNPNPESKICRLMLGESKENARKIFNHWGKLVEYFSA